jgi:hypothetical protein
VTCIVGLVDNGTVYIGGDSAGVGGYDLSVRADEKVFHNGSFLMGFTSSFRMGQLLRYKFIPPEHPFEAGGVMDTYKYMVTVFVDAVRECLKAGGFASKEHEEETGGRFLVGYKGRLFMIDIDYQVGETVAGYDSVGCGAEVALGALYASDKFPSEERVTMALSASAQHNAGVRGPFKVEKLDSRK